MQIPSTQKQLIRFIGWVFGPVWSILFALMAIAAWLVWRDG